MRFQLVVRLASKTKRKAGAGAIACTSGAVQECLLAPRFDRDGAHGKRIRSIAAAVGDDVGTSGLRSRTSARAWDDRGAQPPNPLLLGSAFLSGSENAKFSLSPLDLQKLRRERHPRSDTLPALLDQPRRRIISILRGNEFVHIAATANLAGILVPNARA